MVCVGLVLCSVLFDYKFVLICCGVILMLNLIVVVVVVVVGVVVVVVVGVVGTWKPKRI